MSLVIIVTWGFGLRLIDLDGTHLIFVGIIEVLYQVSAFFGGVIIVVIVVIVTERKQSQLLVFLLG
jgi:hypothetical protein